MDGTERPPAMQSSARATPVATETHLPAPGPTSPLPLSPASASPPGRGVKAWLKTGTGIFSSAVTLLAALLSTVFLLIPSLRPSPPPSSFGATLGEPKIETEVALGDYYARIGQVPPATLTAADLAQHGVIVSFTTVIEGFQGKESRLTWSVLDAETSRRVPESWLLEQPGWPAGVFVPVATRDQGSGEVFVPNPPRPGSYLVRLELFDPQGTRLTSLDSPVFQVAAPAPAPPAPSLFGTAAAG